MRGIHGGAPFPRHAPGWVTAGFGVTLRPGLGAVATASVTLFLSLAALPSASEPDGPAPAWRSPSPVQTPPLDTASLATGPLAGMETTDRRGILFIRVDVLTVRVRFGPTTVARFRRLLEGGSGPGALEDSIAEAAVHAEDVFAEILFHRTVRLDQFADGTRENLRRAAAAGYISEEDATAIGEAIPRWFDFLSERRIREDDRLLYRIRGDSLRTIYLDAGGEALLDQVDVGPERRLAVLGGYFAPGADFREGLIGSLTGDR